jgi:hypothetical protein
MIGNRKGETRVTKVYLVKTYDIPVALMVNSDQIRAHIVSKTRKWTWECKGTKHIKVIWIEGK